MQDRGERRFQTDKVMNKRQDMPWFRGNDIPGRFRKWNGSCQCRMFQYAKIGDIAHQRMKDERRNLIVDVGL